MTNSSPWKDPPFLIDKSMINHLFLWAIYTMAMLNNQMVLHPTTSLPSNHPSIQAVPVPPRNVPGFCSTPRWHRARPRPKWRCVALGGATGNPRGRRRCHSAPGTLDFMGWKKNLETAPKKKPSKIGVACKCSLHHPVSNSEKVHPT